MADRERERDRDRDRERIRDRDRDRDRRRERDDRDRDRDRVRSKRSRTPERTRARHTRSRTRSPDQYHSRSLSRSRTPEDRSHRRRHHHHRSPSPESRKRARREPTVEAEKDRQKAVSEFVEGIAKEQQNNGGGEGGGADEDEIEMMKKLGIPVGFDSTKGKPVPGADVSGVRAVTKRQPRQYMNRRGRDEHVEEFISRSRQNGSLLISQLIIRSNLFQSDSSCLAIYLWVGCEIRTDLMLKLERDQQESNQCDCNTFGDHCYDLSRSSASYV
ncbi:hypothetical protein ACLB2K_040501 [Fragaria x ananassa]